MFLDWLAREGWIVFNWWLLATLAGAAALPLVVRLLGSLPDKGVILARAAGLLLTAYVFWLLTSLGFLRNDTGSIALAWVIVLSIGLAVYFELWKPREKRQPFDWRGWWRENRSGIITAELLFILLFFGWTVVRAHQNSLSGTEKPMDLAFMSAIMRSDVFPPNDPWLSDYAISYYYFGYVMGAMFTKLSGVASTVGYNVWTAMQFALVGLTTFGVVYNLTRAHSLLRKGRGESPFSEDESASEDSADTPPVQREAEPRPAAWAAIATGLLGVFLMIISGNFMTPLVDVPYFSGSASQGYLDFWDVRERQTALTPETARPDPDTWDNWWWFRSARVLHDRNLPAMVDSGRYGANEEVINEFPQFSYLLADNHPHAMALPFTVLAMGLGLSVLLRRRRPYRGEILFYGLCIGALVFLNTWDAPIYIMVLVGADVLRRLREKGRLHLKTPEGGFLVWLATLPVNVVRVWFGSEEKPSPSIPLPQARDSKAQGLQRSVGERAAIHRSPGDEGRDDWTELIAFGVALVLILIVGYLPFLVGFGSQLGGALPNIIHPTWLPQFFLAFGPVLVLSALFLGVEIWRGRRSHSMNWTSGIQAGLLAFLGLIVVMGVFILIGALIPQTRTAAQSFIESAGGWSVFLPEVLSKRLTHGLTTVVLLAGIVLVVARLFPRARDAATDEGGQVTYAAANGYALLLIGAGLSLTLIPEFIYLRDNFGYRMNTIFKFYYQAWALFAVAGAYGTYTILADSRQRLPAIPLRAALGGVVTIALLLGMAYPLYGIASRTGREGTRITLNDENAITLDGWRTLISADDYMVMNCLTEMVGDEPVTLLEAMYPGSYGAGGRASAVTGIPTVLGWAGHQSQWRGRAYGQTVGSRPDDVRRIYEDLRLDAVGPILQRYDVDYILYGTVERNPNEYYGSNGEQKFLDSFDVVCESGNSRVFRVDLDRIPNFEVSAAG